MYPAYEPPPAAFTYSPSLITSTPQSSCRSTTYCTAPGSSAATSAVTTGPCCSSASNSAGRGRLPPCVDRIASVLCFICSFPSLLVSGGAPAELLDLMGGRRCRIHAIRPHPEGVRHLAHVQVTTRVHGDAVRRDEVARRGPANRAGPPPRGDVPVPVEDRDPARPVFRHEPAGERALALRPPQLRHVGEAIGIDSDMTRPLHVGPLRQEPAIGVKHLDPVVLPVTDKHPVIGADGDSVRQVKLPGADPH